MSGLESGLGAAVGGMVSGLVLSIVVNILAPSLGPYGVLLAICYNLASIASAVAVIYTAPDWSLTYLAGWMFGTLVFGQYFLDWWEMALYVVVGAATLALKAKSAVVRSDGYF